MENGLRDIIGKNMTSGTYAPFDLLTDHYEKYIVTLDEITLPSRNGIRHIQAWDIYNFI